MLQHPGLLAAPPVFPTAYPSSALRPAQNCLPLNVILASPDPPNFSCTCHTLAAVTDICWLVCDLLVYECQLQGGRHRVSPSQGWVPAPPQHPVHSIASEILVKHRKFPPSLPWHTHTPPPPSCSLRSQSLCPMIYLHRHQPASPSLYQAYLKVTIKQWRRHYQETACSLTTPKPWCLGPEGMSPGLQVGEVRVAKPWETGRAWSLLGWKGNFRINTAPNTFPPAGREGWTLVQSEDHWPLPSTSNALSLGLCFQESEQIQIISKHYL